MKFCLKPSKKICCKTYALKIHHIKNILGLIRSQIGKLKSGSGRPEVYVNLTEDQAIFVLTLSKNTKQAVELKSLITRSFIYYRRQAEQKKIEPIKEKRGGNWMRTISNVQFWPLDPKPEEILITDIAHAESMLS